MHELDNPAIRQAVTTSLKEQLQVRDIQKIASGNECFIFRAELLGGPVVIKVPKDRIFSNVNDAHIDSGVLLDNEFQLTRHVKEQGIRQVAEIKQILEVAGFSALVMDYIPSDDSKPNQYRLGQLLARIHMIDPSGFTLSAQESSDTADLVAGRLARRWLELDKLVDNLPELLSEAELLSGLEETRGVKQLLHMDFREANFRMQNGEVAAVIDWGNALVGHPALELARVAETGETSDEFPRGYASIRPLPKITSVAETIFRLDTATMLALVFLSEDPDPELASRFMKRVRDLHANLKNEIER